MSGRPNNNKNSDKEDELIPFPPMFNYASNDDDPFTKDPNTSPYDSDVMDDDADDLIFDPNKRYNPNPVVPVPLDSPSVVTMETSAGISLHETEHLLEDGTRVVRTETVDQAGFVLDVNQTKKSNKGGGMLNKFGGNKNKSIPPPPPPPPPEEEPASSASKPAAVAAAIAARSRSRSPVPPPPPPPRPEAAAEEKKEDTIHLVFTPSDESDEEEAEGGKKEKNKHKKKDRDVENTGGGDEEVNDNEYDESKDNEEICGFPKRIFFAMACVLLLVIVIGGIVAGVMLSSSSSDSVTAEASAPSDNNNITPTTNPAAAPTDTPIQIIIATFAPSVAPVVGNGLDANVATLGRLLLPDEEVQQLSIFDPSYRALEWLVEDDDTETNLDISLTEDSQALRERFGVASFYFATNGKGWINSEQWLTPTSVCNWEGVSCRGGNVTALVFNANRLDGELPSTVGQLSYLEILNVPQNQLKGTLSTELGLLTNLEIMNIYSNAFDGTVPTEMGNLENMVEFTLWFNNLNGRLPSELGQLTRLEKLDVAQNTFTSTIPTEFGNLQSVRKLFFDGNSLSGPLPSELGNLATLELLHVPNNQFSGIVPSELENASNLIDVKLSANPFAGGLDALFCGRQMSLFYSDCGEPTLNCPCCTHCCGEDGCNLQTITLAPTMAPTSRLGTFVDLLIGPDQAKQTAILSDPNSPQYKALMWINDENYPAGEDIEDSESLQEVYGLAVLYYATGGDTTWSGGGSWLSPGFPQCNWEFVACVASQVRFLRLINNNLVGTIPEEISKISNLRLLEIRDNPMIPSTIPSQIGDLQFLSNLSLEGISLTGTIPTELMRLQFLTSLDLANNDLVGNIPTRMQQLFNLKSLNLATNALDGGLPTELATLRLLQSIQLQENSLSGSVPIEWGAQILSANPTVGVIPSFEFLQVLRLDQNNLDSTLPIQLGELRALRELHLQDNGLTGVVPTQLMDLPLLQYFRVSSNQLRGTIHTYVGNMQKLSYFNLERNAFSGTIPSEMGSLTSLTSLSLAFNPLVGEIPSDFTNLIRMDRIFLHGTDLVGGLDNMFCDRRLSLYFADCLNTTGTSEISCSCCNYCCDSTGQECLQVQG